MTQPSVEDLNHAVTTLLGVAEIILQERLDGLEHPDSVSVLSDSRMLRQQLATIEEARSRLLQPST